MPIFFKDKIIIVIAHNKTIKNLFKKYIRVDNGTIFVDDYW